MPLSTQHHYVRMTLHWLPIEHCSIFKSDILLVYKFLHNGYSKYFVLLLKSRHCVYNAHKAKLMVCSLRSHSLPLQYISLPSILSSAFIMMLKSFGMICLMMYIWPLLFTHSERSSKPISLHKHIHPNFCLSLFLSMALTLAMSKVNDYSFYPTAFKGCQRLIFTHGGQAGSGKMFLQAVSQKP